MYAWQPSARSRVALSWALALWASAAVPGAAQGPAVATRAEPPPADTQGPAEAPLPSRGPASNATPPAAGPGGAMVPAVGEAEPSLAEPEAPVDDGGDGTPDGTPAASGAPDRTSGDGPEECLRPPVEVTRIFGPHREESAGLRLTRCDGRPNPDALSELSLLARPHRLPRPPAGSGALGGEGGDLPAAPIQRLHPGLLVRLQAIADHFPGRRIEIVSGSRPRARRTSRHHHGRALDLRVAGIERGAVSEFARSLPGTGVGYYPNSTFTHLDVRGESTYWVDRSGPGEPPDYGSWPPGGDEMDLARQRVVAMARSALGRLARAADGSLGTVTASASSGDGAAARDESPGRVGDVQAGIGVTPASAQEDDEPEGLEPLADAELAALRASWQEAIRGLASP